MSEIICDVCMHHCHLKEGKTGMCRARRNVNGVNVCDNYGRLTSLAMDPIEKKPLYHFYPGSWILSAGSYGCNLSCPFCQNASISMTDERTAYYREVSPEQLAELVLGQEDNLGIAFTYNEPMISYEYIIDTARLIRPYDKKTVLVTNGCISPRVLEELLEVTDAMNIDLKGDAQFYRELNGDYDTVRRTIEASCKRCHVEVTTLVIPGKNDTDAFIEEEAEWLASLDPDIVLHLSRYFPRYKYRIPATERNEIFRLTELAKKHLKHVYPGNV